MSETRAAVTTVNALPITGMSCAACAGRVQRALGKVPGVAEAEVNYATGAAKVRGDAALPSLVEAVTKAGYGVAETTLDLGIGGMSCASCVNRVEKALAAVPGVLDVKASLASESAHLRILAGVDRGLLAKALEKAGYTLRAAQDDGSAEAAAAAEARRQGWKAVAALVALAFFIPGMVGMAFGADWMPPAWLQLLLGTAAQLAFAPAFWRRGLQSLRGSTGNMDLLVALGSTAAWGLSTVLFALGHHHALYFDGGVAVLAAVLSGRWLEVRAKRAAGGAIRALLALRPDTATRITADGREEEVPAASLHVGEQVAVRPGQRIPADGVVATGTASIDESMLTGESRAVEKAPGDKVSAGTVSQDGRLVLQITATGNDTLLGKVAALVADAEASRAPIQRLVDRISAVFVPLVVGIAVLTLIGWWALGSGGSAGSLGTAVLHAAAVLVVACPCALGLATPAALMAGTGAAARAGILVRDAAAMERAAEVTLVAFDKTGTLTEGRPRLAALHVGPAVDEATALAWAAALQAGSEHPLARAVLAAAAAEQPRQGQDSGGKDSEGQDSQAALPAEDFRALPGRGVQARVAGHALALGSPRLLQESGITTEALPPLLASAAVAEEARGRTLAWLIDTSASRALALLAFEDAPRLSSGTAIAALQAQDIGLLVLSGDSRAAAATLAGRLGLQAEQVEAGLLPADKASHIATLQASGQKVAMVGDGVNDAPALAAAHLGIAMGSGTDAAIGAAGITLLRPDPALVPAALDLGRRTRGTIRANLVWAFGFNAVGLPLAAFGLLSPALAGVLMAGSSLAVLGMSLLLARWRPASGALTQGVACCE